MRTVRSKVYTFEELSQTAQAKALERFRYVNVEHTEWYLHIYSAFKEEAQNAGFDVAEIYWSGFSSQGDGAVFTGSVSDFAKLLNDIHPLVQKLMRGDRLDLSCKISHDNRYFHKNSATYTFDHVQLSDGNIQREIDKIEHNVKSTHKSLCIGLYQLLEAEYDSFTSDEEVKGTIIRNGYEFYASGEYFIDK